MDLVLLVDFLPPVTLKDSGKSASPMPHRTGAQISPAEPRGKSGNVERRQG